MSTEPRTTVLLRNYYPRDIAVDDVTGDATIPVRIRRFTKDQLMEFQLGWARCENPPSNRYIFRKPDGDEQLVESRRYVVPDAEIRRRRMKEMTPDELKDFDAMEEADANFIAQFCYDAIVAHMWVNPQARVIVEDDQGDPRTVKTGQDLADTFAGNLTLVMRLTRAIYEENTLGPEQKKTLRLLSASTPSSSAPPGAGERPAETAASAAPLDSAESAAAPAPLAQSPSTETA